MKKQSINVANKSLSASVCAISFLGNAKNNLQQDAFFFNDRCIQKNNIITDVMVYDNEFCVAVADGVADSPLSQHASKALVKSVQKNWHHYLADDIGKKPIMTMNGIQQYTDPNAHQYFGAKSTLTLFYRLKNKTVEANTEIVIKHVGDSRIYKQSNEKPDWHFLTRDHNFLNDTLDEQAKAEGKTLALQDYNPEGMASSMYMLTESFVLGSALEFDFLDEENPAPRHDSSVIRVQKGDCFVVCSDGIHDLVPSSQWQPITPETELQDWLQQLKTQVYQSQGNAYDNGTAIVIRFE